MPRKKKDGLPADLEQMLDDTGLDDLRDPEDNAINTIDNSQATTLDEAYRVVAASNHGAAVLRDILEISGFMHSPASYSGELCIYAAARRDVWLGIRKHLPSQLSATIENPLEVIR